MARSHLCDVQLIFGFPAGLYAAMWTRQQEASLTIQPELTCGNSRTEPLKSPFSSESVLD
jgi:hypothetical protein